MQHLLRSPIGRLQFLHGLNYRAWPALALAAIIYRRVFVKNTRVVAVVGSFGKSTTARAVLTGLRGVPTESICLNEWSYVARSILRIRRSDQHAVVEVGIDGIGQMKTYAKMIRPDIVIVTSIGSEHNRSLGSLEQTRNEKADMLRFMSKSGLAIISGDDPNTQWMAMQTSAPVASYGLGKTNDIRGGEVVLDWPHGTDFSLYVNGETRRVHIKLIGKEMVKCILAAVAVAQAEGFSLDEILQAIKVLTPTPGRLEPVVLRNGAVLLRDYFKSSLETIDEALDVLEEIPAKRRIVVLGEVSEPPGSQGPIYRRLGKRIGKMASRAIFVGGNYQRYASGAKQGGLAKENIINAGRSIFKAIQAVSYDLQKNDVVLIKGRDNQRLDRVAHALEGRKVLCDVGYCNATLTRCETCPMLERGWNGLKVVI
jgi:UDP-N-acetylmuramoyl-tripeptide--D-alanyl-D-alanine ligase